MAKGRQRRDGGYGWVIVFAFFLIEVLVDGIRFSFGVYFVEFLDEFKRGKGETAWVGSLMVAIYNLGGVYAFISFLQFSLFLSFQLVFYLCFCKNRI